MATFGRKGLLDTTARLPDTLMGLAGAPNVVTRPRPPAIPQLPAAALRLPAAAQTAYTSGAQAVQGAQAAAQAALARGVPPIPGVVPDPGPRTAPMPGLKPPLVPPVVDKARLQRPIPGTMATQQLPGPPPMPATAVGKQPALKGKRDYSWVKDLAGGMGR